METTVLQNNANLSARERWAALLREQPVLPSPMCGISDWAFRQLCRGYGGAMAYTQMVSAHGICYADQKTMDILDLHGDEPVLGMQLFGADPAMLGEAAARLQELGATAVDLNMGCPAKKIVSGQGGSALLREPDLVRRIFRAMRRALTVPFTAKLRWDFDDSTGSAIAIGRIAEEEGLDGLCLHARTREERYSGRADRSRIRELKQAVSLPVIGNGDVTRPEHAIDMMRATGCDGVMIGRGVIGKPWLMRGALAAVREGRPPEDYRDTLGWDELRELMLRHAAMMVEAKGTRRGLVQFRKHAVQYLRGMPGVKKLRPGLMKVGTLDELAETLNRPVDPASEDEAAAV